MKAHVSALSAVLLLSTPAYAEDKATFAVPGLTMADLAVHYAVDEGFMKKAGVDAEILKSERRDLATMAVLSGDATTSVTDPAEAAIAMARGAKLRVISGLVVNAPAFLVGDKSVTADQNSWKGKTAALFTPPNTLYTIFVRELKEGGWTEVEKNVWRKDASDTPEQYLHVSLGKRGTELPALLAGRASLSVLNEPDASTAVVRGDDAKIHAFSKDFQELLWTTLNTSADTIEKNPETIQKVITALNAAMADMHAHPDKIAAYAGKLFDKADPKVVGDAVKSLIEAGAFPPNCMITEAGWKSNVDLIKLTDPASKAPEVKFDQIADLSFCKKAMAQPAP